MPFKSEIMGCRRRKTKRFFFRAVQEGQVVVSADTDFGDFVGSLGFKGAVYNLVSERGRETTGKVSFITFDSLKADRGRLERRGA